MEDVKMLFRVFEAIRARERKLFLCWWLVGWSGARAGLRLADWCGQVTPGWLPLSKYSAGER